VLVTDPVAVQRITRRAFDWIAGAAVEVDGGLAWSENGLVVDDLYAGTAGVLLACAEASAAGVDVEPAATAARDRLIRLAERGTGLPDDGLFTGWAGVAVALRAWSRASGDEQAGVVAGDVSRRIAERITGRGRDPGRYLDVVLGDAGIVLGLLPDPDADTALTVLADGLASAAESAAGRLHWRMLAGYDYLMPGFSHGTAGVAYALLLAGRRLHRRDLIELAVRAAEGLIALGDTRDGWALPLMLPRYPNRPAVNYGWCHGPTGTARLFIALDALDVRPLWREAADGCLEAIRAARLPIRRAPGFWDNLACCCGTAGVGRLLIDRFDATGERRYLDESARLAADVLARRHESPHGVSWSNTEHTAIPPNLPPEPGFMQGAAGIASWLARLAALATGQSSTHVHPGWI
jgi:lantibiotic modifying enzyme